MTIFITGATGYIGGQVALALLARRFEVVALVRSLARAEALVAAGARLVEGDLTDTAAIQRGMQGCAAVYHLAAYARVWPDDERIYRTVNVNGTRTILEVARQQKVQRVIYTSTAGVYGPSPAGGVAVDEETPRTTPYFTPYEGSKAEAEALAKEYAAAGMHVVVLCPARVYGPGSQSESNAVNKLVCLYREGRWRFLPGKGTGIGSYAYIKDVVAAHVAALHEGRSGESYLLGGENVTYKQFFAILQKLTGKHVRLVKVPAWLLIWLSRLSVALARIMPVRPLLTPGWAKRYLYDWQVSSLKAGRELHYQITPLTIGLKATLESSCYERKA